MVTAIEYQLNWQLGRLQIVLAGVSQISSVWPAEQQARLSQLLREHQQAWFAAFDHWSKLWLEFIFDFLFEPSALGVSAEDSNAVNSNSFLFDLSYPDVAATFWCWGGSGGKLISSWRKFIDSKRLEADQFWSELEAQGASELASFLRQAGLRADDLVRNYATQVSDPAAKQMLEQGVEDYLFAALYKGAIANRIPAGHAPDDPPPEIVPDNLDKGFSGLAPVSWLLDKQRSIPALMQLVKTRVSLRGIYLLGGKIMTPEWDSAVQPAARRAGFMIPAEKGQAEQLLRGMLYSGGSGYPIRGTEFPGGTEYNHHGAHETGPLKADWRQPCPSHLSHQQQDQQCIGLTESVWGTSTLRKLEAIKKGVDPHGLFNCYHCVGYQDPADRQPPE